MTQSNYTYCDKSIGKSNSKRKINAIRNYPCQIEYSGSNHFYRSPFSSCSTNALTSATVEVAEGAVLSTLSTGIALGTCGQLLLICPVDLQPLQACLSCLGSVQAEQCRRTPCLCSNWLNIRPVYATRNRLLALACALRSASCVRRRCRAIGSSIIGGGGAYSKSGEAADVPVRVKINRYNGYIRIRALHM